MVDDTRLALNAPQTATYGDDGHSNVSVADEASSPSTDGGDDDLVQGTIAADGSLASTLVPMSLQDSSE